MSSVTRVKRFMMASDEPQDSLITQLHGLQKNLWTQCVQDIVQISNSQIFLLARQLLRISGACSALYQRHLDAPTSHYIRIKSRSIFTRVKNKCETRLKCRKFSLTENLQL